MNDLTNLVIEAVIKERSRQNKLWGLQRHDMGKWLQILMEEVGELAQAMQANDIWSKQSDAENLLEEAVHVAAVATAIAEQIVEEGGY